MLLLVDEFTAMLSTGLLVFARISAMLIALPALGKTLIPARIRVLAAVMFSITMIPTINAQVEFDPLSLQGMVLVSQQIIIGLALGFTLKLIFEAFVIAGQVIAMQSGLGFAQLVDPGTHNSVPVLSQLYLLLITLLYFALDGHLQAIAMLHHSFTLMPLADPIALDNIRPIIDFSVMMFRDGLLVALPTVIALLVVNLAFGVMNRAAPQLNLFSIGFPMSLMLGVLLVYLTLSEIEVHLVRLLDDAFAVFT